MSEKASGCAATAGSGDVGFSCLRSCLEESAFPSTGEARFLPLPADGVPAASGDLVVSFAVFFAVEDFSSLGGSTGAATGVTGRWTAVFSPAAVDFAGAAAFFAAFTVVSSVRDFGFAGASDEWAAARADGLGAAASFFEASFFDVSCFGADAFFFDVFVAGWGLFSLVISSIS